MSESEQPVDNATPGASEPTVDQAQPYRSPANVSEGTAKAGLLSSPWMWGFAIVFVMAAGAGAVAFFAAPVQDFNMNRRPVEDFGGSRIPPPEEDIVEFLPATVEPPAQNDAVQAELSEPVVP